MKEYSIRELAKLAGVSARTLRYYDELGLLKPLYVSEAGYRFYGEDELNLLQQILFYRERGFELKYIKNILYKKDFNLQTALEEHLLDLENQKQQLDALIYTVKQTLASVKGEYKMSDKEKFQAFKENMIRENEAKYGEEIRKKYGNGTIDASNAQMLNMSEEEWNTFQNLSSQISEKLKTGIRTNILPDSKEAEEIFRLHKAWLLMTWTEYSPQAHKGIAAMYTANERFTLYYDKEVPGCARLLKDIITYWADKAH